MPINNTNSNGLLKCIGRDTIHGITDRNLIRSGRIKGRRALLRTAIGICSTTARGVGEGLLEGEFIAYDVTRVGVALSIASTSTSDTSAGTGAQQVLLLGVDGDGNRAQSLVTMNGTTKVAIGTWMAIDLMVAFVNGSGRGNAGNVYVGTSAEDFTAGKPDTNIYGLIFAGSSVSQYICFFTANNEEIYFTGIQITSDNLDKNSELRVRTLLDLGAPPFPINKLIDVYVLESVNLDFSSGGGPMNVNQAFFSEIVSSLGTHNISFIYSFEILILNEIADTPRLSLII